MIPAVHLASGMVILPDTSGRYGLLIVSSGMSYRSFMIILADITNRIFMTAITNWGDRIWRMDCGIVGCITHPPVIDAASNGHMFLTRASRRKCRSFSCDPCILANAYQTGYWIPGGESSWRGSNRVV